MSCWKSSAKGLKGLSRFDGSEAKEGGRDGFDMCKGDRLDIPLERCWRWRELRGKKRSQKTRFTEGDEEFEMGLTSEGGMLHGYLVR